MKIIREISLLSVRVECDGLKVILEEIGCEYVNYILLAQNRDQWRAVVNILIDFRALEWRTFP
jgi:hypothetical protein